MDQLLIFKINSQRIIWSEIVKYFFPQTHSTFSYFDIFVKVEEPQRII